MVSGVAEESDAALEGDHSGERKVLEQSLHLPESFYIGQAAGEGDCFFDSVAKALCQIHPEQKFTIKSLRMVCKQFAERNSSKDTSHWLLEKLAYEATSTQEPPVDCYIANVEFTAEDCDCSPVLQNGPIWGRPEIEGRILCEEYGIKLHVAEWYQDLDVWTHEMISGDTGPKSALPVYDDNNTVHIVNAGRNHFEPILRKNYFPSVNLQHLNDECKLENLQVEETLRSLGTLLTRNISDGPSFLQKHPCRDNLRLDSGSVTVNCIDIGVKRSAGQSQQDQNGWEVLRDAVVSGKVDIVQRLIQQWRSWPFDNAEFSFQPDDCGDALVNELWSFLSITEDKISGEMRKLLEGELRLRKYLRDIAQTMTSVRDIARKSVEDSVHQLEKHVLISELLLTTCKALTSYTDYHEWFTEKEGCHHHKLSSLLLSLIAHSVEMLQEQSDKLGLPRILYREVEDSLGELLTTLINYERLKYIMDTVVQVKTELLQGLCNKSTPENVDKCESLLRDIRNSFLSHHHGILDVDTVKRLKKHLEDLLEKILAAKSEGGMLDDIYEKSPSNGYLSLIKERLVLDEIAKILQMVHQDDAQWFGRSMLKRILQLSEQSSLKPLRCLTTFAGEDVVIAGGDLRDIWKKVQGEVQDAWELLRAEQRKMNFENCEVSQEKIFGDTPDENGPEEVGCDVSAGPHRQIMGGVTLARIEDEFVQLLNDCINNSSEVNQKLKIRFDRKCTPTVCTKFVAATTRSELKMVTAKFAKQKSPVEYQSSGQGKIAKIDGYIEEAVDKFIKDILDDYLVTLRLGKVSEESFLKFRTSVTADCQVNQITASLQSFCRKSVTVSSGQANPFPGHHQDDSHKCIQTSAAVINTPPEEPPGIPIHVEKMAARKISEHLKGHFTTILQETLSNIRSLIPKCDSFMELLQLCRKNLLLKSSLEMMVWESLNILRAASSPKIYTQLEKVLLTSITFMEPSSYSPFMSISTLSYLSPGSLLGTLNGDHLLTNVLVAFFLTVNGDMLMAIQIILEMDGGLEFLVNSMSSSFDHTCMKKPISKFDHSVDIVRRSRYWKNESWKRTLIALLKNRRVMDNEDIKDQQYVWHVLEMEVFDFCNARHVDLWTKWVNIADIKSPYGYSLLHTAGKSGDGHLVEELLNNGSDVNFLDDDRNTPLHVAAYYDNSDVIEILIRNSANVNSLNNHHFTPLHIAASCGHSRNVRTLLENGAEIEATTENGFTPLFFALPHADVVKQLLDRKANANVRNKENSTPLHEASRFGHKGSLKLLLTTGAQINAIDNSYGTPLHSAVVWCQTGAVRTLLHHGADIYDICRSNCTLAHHVAFIDNTEIMNLLLEKGLKIDKVDEHGMTPLHLAVIGGHDRVVDVLRSYFPTPAFVDAVDVKRKTALHYAVMQEDYQLVEILVRLNACVNVVDVDGSTPLHLAAKNGNEKVAEILMDNGANVEALDHNMSMPLNVAAKLGYKDFCDAVMRSSNDGQMPEELQNEQDTSHQPIPLSESIKSLSTIESSTAIPSSLEYNRDGNATDISAGEISDKNLAKHANNCMIRNIQKTDQQLSLPEPNHHSKPTNLPSNQNNQKHNTSMKGREIQESGHPWALIHFAVINNDVDVVGTLLINGGVDTLGGDDITSLHLAAEMGYTNCVDILLSKKADVNTVSGFHQRTALHFASRNGHDVTIEKLIANGADINCRDDLGNTPVHLAAERGETQSVELLLDNGAILDCYNDTRSTPLHTAALNGQVDVLEVLLKHGADCNDIDADDCSPLFLSVLQGDNEATTILLSHGAETNILNKDGWAPLHIATQNDNVGIIRTLLDSQANVDIGGQEEFCPLHLAAINRSARALTALLDGGADVNKRNDVGHTALHVACQIGDCVVIQLLLANSANPEASDVNGFTPLLVAIQNGHSDVVQQLVDAGAHVEHYCAKYDIRPVYAAIACKRLDILQRLLNGGAKMNAQNKNHITPLWFAAYYNFLEAVELLLGEHANINAADKQNNTALHIAARNGHLRVVDNLLLHGASVDAMNNSNWTPLHEAIKHGHREVVASLLARGASLEIPSEKSFSALHLAAGCGDLEIVCLLDAANADVNGKDRDNCRTPLHHAVQNGHLEVAQFLILNGASINTVDSTGFTPLRSAISIRNASLVNLLLDNGANANALDDTQVAPLQIAVTNGAGAEIIQLLLDSGANVNSSTQEDCSSMLHLAIANDDVSTAEVLLVNGADVNARNKTGATPLHVAARQGHSRFVRLLIESFANVNCSTAEGLMPLHEASGEGHLEVVNILLEHSADVNAAAISDHCRPLHCAASEGHTDVVESLLNRGAEVDAALKCGKTALYLAAAGGHVGVVKALLQIPVNAHSRTANGCTMLHAAAMSNDIEIIRVIFKAMTTDQSSTRQNLEATNNRGDTALIHAAWSKKNMSVNTLLKLGANPNSSNNQGFTGLHYAARNGDKDIVDSLCRSLEVDNDRDDAVAAVDTLNGSGDSALHLAILNNKADIVEILLQSGANVHLLNSGHLTPAHMAAEKNFSLVLEVLCRYGADVNASNNEDAFTPLHLAAMEGNAKVAKELIWHGAFVDQAISGFDITPLYLATQNGHVKAAKILLDSGANPVAVNYPNTVLHAAVYSGSIEMVKLVFDKINCQELYTEPFLNALDYAGDTPLMWAAQAGTRDICKALLDYGADVHHENEKKMTALHWAALKGHPDVVRLLLRHRVKRGIQDIEGNTPLYLAMCGKAQESGRADAFDRVIQMLSKK